VRDRRRLACQKDGVAVRLAKQGIVNRHPGQQAQAIVALVARATDSHARHSLARVYNVQRHLGPLRKSFCVLQTQWLLTKAQCLPGRVGVFFIFFAPKYQLFFLNLTNKVLFFLVPKNPSEKPQELFPGLRPEIFVEQQADLLRGVTG